MESFVSFGQNSSTATTFLEFLETWKCQRIWLRSGEKPEVWERSGNLCSHGNFIVAVITYLYFIRTLIHFSYVLFTENSD